MGFVAAVAAVVGTVTTIEAAKQQKKAAAAAARQQQVQAERSQRQAIREAQILRAQTQATAGAAGVMGGSALGGGLSSLGSQTGSALGYAGQMSGLSKQIGIAQGKAATLGAISSLSFTAFNAVGGFGSIFPDATGIKKTDTEALTKGIGDK